MRYWRELVTRYGKEWDGRGAQKGSGKRPLEASASVVEDYDLPCTPADFNEAIALLQDRFLEAARQLCAEPSKCLVIEDAPAGVLAGKALGMQVVAVPSMPSKDARPLYSSANVMNWWSTANGAVVYERGPVIKGFGRGSKILGIPTANLPTSAFSRQLTDHVCGIYIGWAGLSNRGVYKMVMSVGWNPYFDNSQKAVEAWILHDFSEDFYGEELRLIFVGYIRPEANFTTSEDLVEKIHENGRIAKAALEMKPFSDFVEDSYLTTPLPVSIVSN